MPAPVERTIGDATRWISARARNALRRPTPILAFGSVVFVAAVVAFLIVPYQMNRGARALAPRPGERPDTTAILARLARAESAFASARGALANAREEARLASARLSPELPPETVARRDSLRALAAGLAARVDRAESAPLAASFRAVAEHPAVRGERRVEALTDSLEEVERQREVFGAAGGVDPIYVALTSRATALGRAILDVAQARIAALRSEAAALDPPEPSPDEQRPAVDTMPFVRRYAAAGSALDSARAAIAQARAKNAELDARAERAQQLAIPGASPIAVLFAAVVLAFVSGYALALILEFRHPRVADAREVERLTGVRVLGVVRPHVPPPERARRRADRIAPPLIVATDETYRHLYLHLATSKLSVPLVMFTGEDPAITGVVAANVAAMAAYDARSTLIVDADLDRCTLAAVLRVPFAPGLAEILRGQVDWSEVAVPAVVGRDRAVYVLPSGGGDPPPLTDELRRALRDDLERMTRRYDFVVVVSPHTEHADVGLDRLPVADVVYCVEAGRTSLAQLMRVVRELQESGASVRGIVLWDLDVPELPTRRELAWAPSATAGVHPDAARVGGLA